ncbi:unnamed protein product [Pylaiella littoralis]
MSMGNRRTGSRNRRSTTVGFAALVAFSRRSAETLASDDTSSDPYPYIGCYKDEKQRAMSFVSRVEVTKEGCAALCIDENTPYFGLQYGSECFCGDNYDRYGAVEQDDGYDCDMTLEFEPDVEAGGKWAMSIYSTDAGAAVNAITASSGGTGAGSTQEGTTTVESSTRDAVTSGKRAFTVVNECSQTIRIGSTGGRISFEDAEDDSADACAAFGPAGVYNSGELGRGCYWDLPAEEGGNTDRMLEPGNYFRYYLAETTSNTRWSGTIWAGTGCDKIDGCATGFCYNENTDHVCPAYIGPGGSTSKGEFTLSDFGKDYYDISLIDGANLPMVVEPDNPVFPSKTQSDAQNIFKYQCGSPGATSAHLDSLADCSWSFDTTVSLYEEDLSKYVRLVLPDYDKLVSCDSDDECDEVCGVHPKRYQDGSFIGGVEGGSCGEHVGWVSAGGACAGGWDTGEFPDSFPYYCGTAAADDNEMANMYGCFGGSLGHSGYTAGATNSSCGCPDWEGDPFYLTAPAISDCQATNPEWIEYAFPWAGLLKKACPTAYTFPYDDQTSTFTCYDGEGPGTENYVNTQSYTITFCPGDSEKNMYG